MQHEEGKNGAEKEPPWKKDIGDQERRKTPENPEEVL